ncbi:hypothetical protein CHGG_10597 [Chaetomium globosum CBS 148.51]|uniref:DUF7703 domain-containing protein n=1 Tax=Chaetomium globosum (strain ATCC 6205 / CBS 148.51 / DSM 1962 / NBRC 6347 / NRRL 1970) TaxID=306901 RepID=Q2GN57_CHAGB|nr:uncharacterized protein CHGG_10597 [Chaetomium globosum CBS 148.51]EAQ84193.1 hypothetical protein CHGG_10597 [Chaetomium globosum CBS 148.51]
MAPKDNGISRESVPTGTTLTIIVVFISVALYNVGELAFIIMATFKRRSGLYFWSFVVATGGIVPYAVGFLIKALQSPCPNWLYVTMIVVGWCCMVTGQSVVLYSRLHLVLRNERRLRMVLIMIITNAIICHIPITVMVYGANSSNPDPFVAPYSVYERVQVTLFFIQEAIISALYIHETVELMRTRSGGGMDGGARGSAARWLMTHLIAVNIIVVMLDVTILALEYAGLYDVQTSCKALAYSIKLKLEFSVLNRLVEITRGGTSGHDSSYDRTPVDRSGVRMGTLDGEQRRNWKSQAGGGGSGMGNRVHVRSCARPSVELAEPAGASVMMTTEVTVQRVRRGSISGVEGDGDGGSDLVSIGEASGMTLESTTEGTAGQSRAPSHSSERQIIERVD